MSSKQETSPRKRVIQPLATNPEWNADVGPLKRFVQRQDELYQAAFLKAHPRKCFTSVQEAPDRTVPFRPRAINSPFSITKSHF